MPICLSKLYPKRWLSSSNSSTLLPSQLAPFTNRPQQFINLHFANHIHIRNTAEVMGHAGTDPAVYDQIVEFAKAIGMVPVELHKEQSGYVLDSLLIPLLIAGMGLWANDVADPATIDKTWMIATGALFGPMAILDKNGMNTNYNVVKAIPGELTQHIAEKMKTELIDKGKLGEVSGEGFYTYPNPAYEQKDFLT
jgi:3-hydroxybutyryl-CoA dehydrogenase